MGHGSPILTMGRPVRRSLEPNGAGFPNSHRLTERTESENVTAKPHAGEKCPKPRTQVTLLQSERQEEGDTLVPPSPQGGVHVLSPAVAVGDGASEGSGALEGSACSLPRGARGIRSQIRGQLRASNGDSSSPHAGGGGLPKPPCTQTLILAVASSAPSIHTRGRTYCQDSMPEPDVLLEIQHIHDGFRCTETEGVCSHETHRPRETQPHIRGRRGLGRASWYLCRHCAPAWRGFWIIS